MSEHALLPFSCCSGSPRVPHQAAVHLTAPLKVRHGSSGALQASEALQACSIASRPATDPSTTLQALHFSQQPHLQVTFGVGQLVLSPQALPWARLRAQAEGQNQGRIAAQHPGQLGARARVASCPYTVGLAWHRGASTAVHMAHVLGPWRR